MKSLHLAWIRRITALAVIGTAIVLPVTVLKAKSAGQFNQPGNILITDQFSL